MKTLNLSRKFKSHYELKCEGLTITVINPFLSDGIGSKSWNIVIEFYNGIESDYIYISEYFETKKQASIFGARWIEKNIK